MAMDIALTGYARYSMKSLQPVQGAAGSRTQVAPNSSLAAFAPGRLKLADGTAVQQTLSGQASDLSGQKLKLDDSISTVRAGQSGAISATVLLAKMKGLVQDARQQSATGQAVDTVSFNNLAKQLSTAVSEGSYRGLNLINDSTASLAISFHSGSGSTLTVSGANLNASAVLSAVGKAGGAVSNGVFADMAAAAGAVGARGFSALNAGTASGAAVFDKMLGQLDSAISNTQATADRLGKNIGRLVNRSADLGGQNGGLNGGLNGESAGPFAAKTGQQIASLYGNGYSNGSGNGYSGGIAGSQWQAMYAMLR